MRDGKRKKIKWESGSSIWSSYNPFNLNDQPEYVFRRKPSDVDIGKYKSTGSLFGKTTYVDNSFSKKNINMSRKRIGNSPSGGVMKKRIVTPEKKFSPRSFRKNYVNITRSPGFVKNSIFGYKMKKKSMSGATTSRSRGKFRKGRKIYTFIDKFARRGIVTAREIGGVMSTSAAEAAQSFLVGHSVFSKVQLVRDVSFALAKMCALRLKQNITDLSESVFGDAGFIAGSAYYCRLYYVTSPGGSVNNVQLTFTGITNPKWSDVASSMQSQITTLLAANSGLQFTKLTWDNNDAATTSTRYMMFSLDLSRARIRIQAKSSLKIQNRTINASGNVEADDVDNVPIYGKSYSGYGNYIMLNNSFTVAGGNTSSYSTLMTGKFSSSSNPSAREPLPLSMVKRAKKVGKAHLDPGEIKTSVLNYSKTFLLNSLIRKLIAVGDETTTGSFVDIGIFRCFLFEKMLQAVATSDVNGLNIAYELDQKTGIEVVAPQCASTSFIIDQSPV